MTPEKALPQNLAKPVRTSSDIIAEDGRERLMIELKNFDCFNGTVLFLANFIF